MSQFIIKMTLLGWLKHLRPFCISHVEESYMEIFTFSSNLQNYTRFPNVKAHVTTHWDI